PLPREVVAGARSTQHGKTLAEAWLAQLAQRDRIGEPFELELAPQDELVTRRQPLVNQPDRVPGEEDLAAVSGVAYPRDLVHGDRDVVALRGRSGRAGMQAHPHPDLTSCRPGRGAQLLLGIERGGRSRSWI